MRRAALVAVLALSLSACTSLLGVDGDYDAAPTGGGGGAGGATGTAVSSVIAGTTGTDAGAGAAPAGGGGGDGGAPPATTGSGGSEPVGPGTCARCKVDFVRGTIGGSAPQLAHRSNRFWMTFLRESTAILVDDVFDETNLFATAPSFAIPIDDPTFTGPQVYLVEDGALRRNDQQTARFDGIGEPFLAAVRTSGGHPFVAASLEGDLPALLDCSTESCVESTDQTCLTPTASAGRGFDVDRNDAGTLVQFARLCGTTIQVSSPGQRPDYQLPAEGADEIAFALGEDRYLLAVRGSGRSDARVVVYREDAPILTRDVTEARSPAMVAIDGESALGVVVGDGGLVMVECVGSECTVGHLDAGEAEGASAPSLGVFRTMDGPPVPWIAWEALGGVRWGRLIAADAN